MMVKFARNEVIQKVKTLHQTLGDDFANDYRSKAHLGNVLKKEGVETLDQLIKKMNPTCLVSSSIAKTD